MSRIGKLPIPVPAGVEINVKDNLVTVKGKHGELSQQVKKSLTIKVEDGQVTVERKSDSPSERSAHGLYRSLINNMIVGVSEQFSKKMEVIGVGYRAAAKGQILELNLGFSHPILMQIPNEVKVEATQEKRQNAFITLTSYDKQLLGHVAAKIRSFRPPEPYKGKGIRYIDEYVRTKEGKKSGD